MFEINENDQRTIQIVVSRDDLEEAIRAVVGEILTEKEEASRDARITKAAARERLKVDDTTLWRWDKCGYLKAIHIGRSVYYREADIKRLEEGRL